MRKEQADGTVYDVVIVGAGPAGIGAALRLADRHGRTVALVDSGGEGDSVPASALSRVAAEGNLASGYFPEHAQRRLGGTSSVWSGFCTVMEQRAFTTGQWPIAYEALARYYPDAADVLNLPGDAHRRPNSALRAGAGILYRPYYLSPPVRFAHKYGAALREHPRVDLYLDHTCTKLLHSDGRVDEMELFDMRRGTRSRLEARRFVLACGGLGNPRLLLLSGWPASPALGAYLMEHPHIYRAGTLVLDKALLDGVAAAHQGPRKVHALQLADTLCVDQGLLNFTVSYDTATTDERMLLARRREVYVSKAVIRAEMQANPENRVFLGASRDSLGQRETRVRFHFDFAALARRAWASFARELLAAGIGRAGALSADLAITGGGHYVGTTRMGADPARAVVDGDCKVHGSANLFVAGSSVFPAGGAANPTFSIVALALRLADHLGSPK